MFELEKAIDAWRNDASEHVPGEDLEELESHLRDDVDKAVEAGFTEEEGFVLACHRLGDTATIGRELVRESGVEPEQPKPVKNRRWLGFLAPVAVCFAVLLALEWFQWYSHESYESQVTIEIRPQQTGAAFPLFENREAKQPFAEVDMETELEILRGKSTLYEAIDRLQLDRQWDTTRLLAFKRIRRQASISQTGDSKMVRIRFRDSDPTVARDVGNAIASAYSIRKREVIMKMHNDELDTLHKQLKDQSDKVEEARLKMLDLSERYRILPEDGEIIAEQVRKLSDSLTSKEILRSENPDDEELDKQLQFLKALQERARDDAMDYHRKRAEWGEAKKEFELQTQMLEDMQESFAKISVLLSMPLKPMVVHEDAEVDTKRDSANWPVLMAKAGRNGWGWLLASAVLGAALANLINRNQHRGFNASKLARDEELSWA